MTSQSKSFFLIHGAIFTKTFKEITCRQNRRNKKNSRSQPLATTSYMNIALN